MTIFKKNKGFTLIELIVSISIMAIISALMLANFRMGGVSEELGASAQNIASEIRKAQSYALSYKEFNGSIQEQGGWGIRLTDVPSADHGNIIIFFDLNNSGQYDPLEELYVASIGKNTKVSKILVNSINYSNIYFTAIFYPPDPKIMLRGYNSTPTWVFGDLNTSADEVEIELEHVGGRTKSIIINKFGLIDVN